MSETRTFRYELLDPLRGIAILMVMLLHFVERGIHSGDQLIDHWIWPIFQHGYLGVQLFFVISGYCITAAVYSGLEKKQSVWTFLRRRAKRIFPPYWFSILLVVLMGIATITILNTPQAIVFPLAPWEWAANIALIQGPLRAQDANMVYWSLSIEIQFYLIMAVCLLLGRRGIEAWLICVSACSLILNQAHWIDLSGLIPTYWLQFACGIAAFYWITGVHRIKATPWILLLIPLVATCLSWKAHYTIAGINANYLPSIKLLFCAAAAICMKLTYASDKRIIQLPASRCLAALGTISYSLYLTHVPFGSRIFNLGERLIGSSALQWCLCMPVAFLLSILFGYSFYLLCERSFINPR